MTPLQIMERYAWSLIGTPYLWGGANPLQGFDCNGLCQDILRSVGEDPPGDQTAQGYFDYFRTRSRFSQGELAALSFYGKNERSIVHAAFVISPLCIIEAGGGDSTTTSLRRAIEQNAFTKVSVIKRRADLVAILRPNYSFERKMT